MSTFTVVVVTLLCLAFVAIGTAYLISPLSASRSFGLPLPDGSANVIWWLRLKGVRDTAGALILLAVAVWSSQRSVGLVLLAQTLIPVGDMLLILAANGSTKRAVGIHGVTAAVMGATAVALLMGGR